ncbi:hypothetical protein [Hazenella coriacea]|uniref:hypothetical protein n=1 Tax=Hazenella coriacea TaxID=1179467 RepID=UPI003C755472
MVSHSITIKVIVNFFRSGSIETVWEGPDTHWASVYLIQCSPNGVTILFEDEKIFPKVTR